MRAACTAAIIVAGCSTSLPPGINVQVILKDPSIDRVELIVGAPCESCPSIMGAPAVAPREAIVLSSAHDKVWFAPREGNEAHFKLTTEGDKDQVVPVLAVIGFAGDRAVAIAVKHDVVVPAGPGEYWRMYLSPIDDISDGAPAPDGTRRYAVWRYGDQPDPSCLMIEHWEGGSAKTAAVVPLRDPDCDNVTVNECAPYEPNAMNAPLGVEKTSCWRPDTTLDSVCKSGGPGCTDGQPTTSGDCIPLATDYCVPNDLCACTAHPVSCLVDLFLDSVPANQVPHVSCQLFASRTTGALCAGAKTVPIDLGTLLASGTSCDSVRLLVGYVSNPMPQYMDKFTVGTTAEIGFGNYRPACGLDLTFMGTYDTPGGTFTNGHMLDLDLSNGKHLLIPMRVDLESLDCGNIMAPFLCTVSKGLDTTDRISACSAP